MTRALAVLLLLAGTSAAQDAGERLELARRWGQVEQVLAATPEPAARARAMPALVEASSALVTGRLDQAARHLDEARFRLVSEREPDAAARAAARLSVQPARHILDPTRGDLPIVVAALYERHLPLPVRLRLVATRRGPERREAILLDAAIESLPSTLALPAKALPPGDHRLELRILQEDRVLDRRELALACIPEAAARAAGLAAAAAALPAGTAAWDRATLQSEAALLAALATGRSPAEVAAVALLQEADRGWALLRQGKPWLSTRTGDLRAAIPIGGRTVTARLSVPAQAAGRRPLLIALHGPGGSESLWFESYGGGRLIELANDRGMIVAALRLETAGDQDLASFVEVLARIFAVDPARVHLLGHSLGAGVAQRAVERDASPFLSLALLGGGVRPHESRDLARIAVFAATGQDDFARSGVLALRDSLEAAGHPRMRFLDYAPCENLLVVQSSLPDLFAWLDGLPAR
jgi:hypothetical protein